MNCIEGEEQWKENPHLGEAITDDLCVRCDALLSYLLLPVCQEAGDPKLVTGGGEHSKLGEFLVKDMWDTVLKDELNSTNRIPTYSPIG